MRATVSVVLFLMLQPQWLQLSFSLPTFFVFLWQHYDIFQPSHLSLLLMALSTSWGEGRGKELSKAVYMYTAWLSRPSVLWHKKAMCTVQFGTQLCWWSLCLIIFSRCWLTCLMWYCRYVFDYHPGEVYWCTADIGWITGHSYITYGPLANGATSVLVS